jgi:hypothetical protein
VLNAIKNSVYSDFLLDASLLCSSYLQTGGKPPKWQGTKPSYREQGVDYFDKLYRRNLLFASKQKTVSTPILVSKLLQLFGAIFKTGGADRRGSHGKF